MSGRPARLLAGQIGKPHGLAGDVYVVRISDDPQRFAPGSRLLHEDGRTLIVERARPHRARFLVKFEGADDRASAEGLRGALFVPAHSTRTLEEDEFWEHELIGATVARVDGTTVGRVVSIDAGPGQDRLVVETAAGDRYVPLVRDIVRAVDAGAGRVIIDPPEGLLE